MLLLVLSHGHVCHSSFKDEKSLASIRSHLLDSLLALLLADPAIASVSYSTHGKCMCNATYFYAVIRVTSSFPIGVIQLRIQASSG